MQSQVLKRILLIQQQVPQKDLQVLRRFVNAFFQIVVIRPGQRITEIPGLPGKNIICHFKAQCAEIPDKKDSCLSCIAFSEEMNLSHSGYKDCQTMDNLIRLLI